MFESIIGQIQPTNPRETVRISFADGQVLEAPVNTPLGAFLERHRQLSPDTYQTDIMGGVFNGKLRELSFPIPYDGKLDPVLRNSSDGGRIYRRSLVMLLATAVDEMFAGVKVGVHYAVPEGGYYCTLRNRDPLTPEELEKLETHMHHMVAQDYPIHKRVVPIQDALDIFNDRHADDKLRLLEGQERDHLVLYKLNQRTDYYFGYMLPTVGALKQFRLHYVQGGFILQYPRSHTPNELQTIRTESKLNDVFQQADHWLKLLGVEDIGRLNGVVRNDRISELILVAEALHEQRVAAIATDIKQRNDQHNVRVVLIAGPSSSGKTTFSKRLAIQLLAHGLQPFTLEMDNYFVDRELNPRDESGEYDFEAIGALNVALFNEHLIGLIGGDKVQLPKFNFITGKSEKGREVQINQDCIIIIEGIHGLNPSLVPDIPDDIIYRVYVSALTQLNVDAHNRVPTTDVRLLRRIVRDARTRGYTATDTLTRWESVGRGEKRNIFPYQENADSMFNSALVYELAALRPLAEPLLLQVTPNTPPHIEANRLLSFLRWVHPLQAKHVETIPDISLLREFIGGSSLDNYHPEKLIP